MKTRLFRGAPVSEVGLGCWQFSGSDWGDVSEDDALATLHAAADAGVTFLDTADVYGAGRSERIIGRFLRERGSGLFVATKFGRLQLAGHEAITEAFVREATEGSLRRLGVDALDLTQLHCLPRTLMERGEVFECLRRLQREGKVQHFGASVETVEEGLLCTRVEGLASLQVIFNVLRQKPAAELFEEARRRGVAIIVRLPLASGLLGGHLRADTTFPKNDHRRYNRDGRSFNVGETFAGLPFAKGVELAETLRPLVPPGMTSAQFALRWCLDHDAVTTVIPGAKRPQQARENAEASGLPPLAPALHDELRAFYRERVEAHIRGPY